MISRVASPLGAFIDAAFGLCRESLRRQKSHLTLAAAAAVVAGFCIVGFQIYAPQQLAVDDSLDFLQHFGLVFVRVPRNFDALLITVAFVLCGITPGYLFTAACRVSWRSLFERLLFSAVVGLAIMTFVILALGSVGLLRPLPVLLVCGALLIATGVIVWREIRRAAGASAASVMLQSSSATRRAWLKEHWGLLALAAIVVFYLVVILLPGALEYEMSFDGMHYHLAEGKRWAVHGGFYNLILTERAYEDVLPHYQEDLFAGLIVLGGLMAAKVLTWVQAGLTVASLCLFSYELLGSLAIGLLASIAFLGTPVVMFTATSASNDIPSAAATTLAIYALLRWRSAKNQVGFLVIAGALIGFCAGVKPFGLLSLVTLGAFVILSELRTSADWRARIAGSVRAAVIFVAAFIAFVLPSCINDWLWIGNPYWPLFSGQHIVDGKGGAYGSNVVLNALLLPWSMLTDPSYKNLTGPLFVVMGIPALVALVWRGRNPIVLTLAYIAACWSVLLFIAGAFEARYAEAVFPIISIVLVYPLVRPIADLWQRLTLRYALVGVFVAITVLNLPFLLPLQKILFAGGGLGGVHYNWAYLYDDAPYHGEPPQNIPMIPYLNANLAPTDKVYDDADLVGANVYSNPELVFDAPPFAHSWSLTSPNAPAEFAANGIGYLVTFAKNVPALSATPLGPHLHEVTRFIATQIYGGDHQYDEILYRFVATPGVG